MLHVFMHVCKVAEENRCLSSPVSRDKPGAGLTTELYIYMYMHHVTPLDHTRVVSGTKRYCIYCRYTLYTIHCIVTVLLKYAISYKMA